MANADKLKRAENELEAVNKQLTTLQERAEAVRQRVFKLRSEKILELVKNAGMGPDEIKEMLSAYREGRMLQRFEAESGPSEGGTGCTKDNGREVETENETI